MVRNDFDPGAVAEGLRQEAAVVDRLLKALPVENQVDEGIRASLEEAAKTQERLLIWAFLIEHEADLDRHAEELQAELRSGSMTPGHTLEDAIARFG